MCQNQLSFVEFSIWKVGYEKPPIHGSSKIVVKIMNTLYYYCNRSGHFKSRKTGKRYLKTQGTSKISGNSTAAIIVRVKIEKRLEVMLHKTHYGHQMSLAHLRIPETNQLAIASKLAAGVEFQRILDDVRDNIGDKYQIIHLITRKDVKNMEQTYCFIENQRHPDDATSVHLWVEEMAAHKLNRVLFYKSQGQIPSKECENLSVNDFAIGLQTPLQADILKQFSLDSVICVDSTHGTNGYNFNLITIIVVDEYGEGYPVAWCVSNREDQVLLQVFYNSIKKKVGMFSPKFFFYV